MSGGPYPERDAVENLQDYIEERLETSSGTSRLEQENRTLEQEEADLRALKQERGGPSPRPDIDRLIEEAQLRVDRMQLRQGAERADTPGSQLDLSQTPPEAEARATVTNRMNEQTGYGNVKP